MMIFNRVTKIIALAFFMAILGLGSVQAQPAPTTPESGLTRDGKPKAKEVRAACRAQAEAKGLKKGDAFRGFMKECIGAKRPDLVKAFECRQEAKAKKIEKSEIKAYIKECKGGAGKKSGN